MDWITELFSKSPETMQNLPGLTITAGRCIEGLCDVHVSVTPPDAQQRPGRDIACVIDISSSMGAEAKIQGDGGKTETHGLSLLDIAKHAVRTIIHTLGAKDRLSIVSFADYATTELHLTYMDEQGKARAQQSVDALRPRVGTQLWTGLKHGLEALRASPGTDRQGHVMLLTDGYALDKTSVLPNFQDYIKKHGGKLPGIVSTFGFGYRIDSDMLVRVAAKGSGSYCFIPDSGFVGTVFVNAMSNSLVTMANEAYLEVKPVSPSGVEIVTTEGSGQDGGKTLGGFSVTKENGCFRMNIGSLLYGQTRDVIVPVRVQGDLDPMITATLTYEAPAGTVVLGPAQTASEASQEALELIEVHRCRTIFIETVPRIMMLATGKRCDDAVSALQRAVQQIESSPARENAFIQDLLQDMNGQCTEAVSSAAWFKKWGRHFLPSILIAHKLQQCNNFKDFGLQHYGGKLFEKIRDEADDAFNTLPAPKPSARHQATRSVRPQAAAPVRSRAAPERPQVEDIYYPVNMAAYNNCYGG